jgi:REP element-mobilizing transposase RayT
MPRKPREEEAGAIHHVFARQNDGRLLYRDDGDRQRYLAMLAGVAGRFGWRCLTYCLMPNHLHLLVETPQPNLGRGMQRLHGDYGRWFADRRGKPGHAFGGRYGAVRVRDDAQLWAAVSYIARNPVEARLCAGPQDWRWSAHAAILHGDHPAWLAVARLLELLGGFGGGDARHAYAAYVADRELAPRSPPAARRRLRARV